MTKKYDFSKVAHSDLSAMRGNIKYTSPRKRAMERELDKRFASYGIEKRKK